jgi:hypothetical protein
MLRIYCGATWVVLRVLCSISPNPGGGVGWLPFRLQPDK